MTHTNGLSIMKNLSLKFALCATIGCALLTLATGCATGDKSAGKKTYTFFPPAPDEPRIQFLNSFNSDADLGRTRSFADFITGEQPTGPLVKPYGLALHEGSIFVCDTVQNLIEVFDLKKHRAVYFAPSGEGRLRVPVNITIDADGTRYVADSGRRQVVIYDADGNYLEALGKQGEMKPVDVVLTADRLYVADMQNHAVRVFGKKNHELLFSIPASTNASEGKLYSPANLALDNQGHLIVSDVGAFAVRVYDSDGKFVRTIGRQGVGAGSFARPKGVAADRQGLIYVVDAATQVVQIFDSEGRLLLFFGAPGASLRGQLVLPASVKVDYDHVGYFQKYVAPGYQCEYLILVTSQFGDNKVNVYGFLKKK